MLMLYVAGAGCKPYLCQGEEFLFDSDYPMHALSQTQSDSSMIQSRGRHKQTHAQTHTYT